MPKRSTPNVRLIPSKTPPRANQGTYAAGDLVKVRFLVPYQGKQAGERMWVKVTEVTASGGAGILDNDSSVSAAWKAGKRVSFKTEDVYDRMSAAQVKTAKKDSVGGAVLFDPALPGKQPSPTQLVQLMSLSPELYAAYLPLFEIEQLSDPTLRVPKESQKDKLGICLELLGPDIRADFLARVIPSYWTVDKVPLGAALHGTVAFVRNGGTQAQKEELKDDLDNEAYEIADDYRSRDLDEEGDPKYWRIQAMLNFLEPSNVGWDGAAIDVIYCLYGDEYSSSFYYLPKKKLETAIANELEGLLRTLHRRTLGTEAVDERVGSSFRGFPEIMADPLATAEEILAQEKRMPFEAMQHPNCPPAIWWRQAARYPIEAQQTALFGLMTLEEPERWGDMEAAKAGDWLTRYIGILPERALRLFAVDCAKHTLPLLEKSGKAPARAIATARAVAQGTATFPKRELADAFDAMVGLGREMEKLSDRYRAAKEAAKAVELAVSTPPLVYISSYPGKRLWQWRRFLTYYHREFKTAGDVVGGYAPFDPLVPGKQPDPNQLKVLAALSPEFARQYAPLIEMEQLAEADFKIKPLTMEEKLGKGLQLLEPKQRRLWTIGWVKRALPVLKRAHPEAVAAAKYALEVAEKVIRGTQGETERAKAAAVIQEIQNQIEGNAGAEETDAGYGMLEGVALVLWPLTGLAVDAHALFAAADALAWNPRLEELSQATMDEVRQEQLAELIAKLRLPIHSVGARKSTSVDPMATPAQVEAIRKKDPIAALRHPNCPTSLWWVLAAIHPIEAEKSALYPLLTLEEPGRWLDMEADHISYWLVNSTRRLSAAQRHLFQADCAEHVLPLFERKAKREKRPREAIRVRRLYAQGKATEKEWDTAYDAAKDAWWNFSAAKSQAASDAAEASFRNSQDKAIEAASWTSGKELWVDRNAEKRWQWARLKQYMSNKAGAR